MKLILLCIEHRKLQDDINSLRKKNSELENLLIRKESSHFVCSTGRDGVDGSTDSNILEEFDKSLRQAKHEKSELEKVRIRRILFTRPGL